MTVNELRPVVSLERTQIWRLVGDDWYEQCSLDEEKSHKFDNFEVTEIYPDDIDSLHIYIKD